MDPSDDVVWTVVWFIFMYHMLFAPSKCKCDKPYQTTVGSIRNRK
jgi:hypothetical protein